MAPRWGWTPSPACWTTSNPRRALISSQGASPLTKVQPTRRRCPGSTTSDKANAAFSNHSLCSAWPPKRILNKLCVRDDWEDSQDTTSYALVHYTPGDVAAPLFASRSTEKRDPILMAAGRGIVGSLQGKLGASEQPRLTRLANALRRDRVFSSQQCIHSLTSTREVQCLSPRQRLSPSTAKP
jgi:hypothetical protein